MSEALNMRWYVIQCLSGTEKDAVKLLHDHIKLHHLERFFGKIMIPVEEVLEMKRGQRRKSERKFFPGYVLVQMMMNEESWHLVRNVPRIMGFIGGTADHPIPLNEQEVNAILQRIKRSEEQPKPKVLFEVGEMVRINEGPFADFHGIVEKIDYEKNHLTVSVSIFGRSTPVELDFHQVDKN
ncbi:MAG: transcription termination/antitermination protein NusG [Candidatus Dasytiphilus stammeri]